LAILLAALLFAALSPACIVVPGDDFDPAPIDDDGIAGEGGSDEGGASARCVDAQAPTMAALSASAAPIGTS